MEVVQCTEFILTQVTNLTGAVHTTRVVPRHSACFRDRIKAHSVLRTVHIAW